MKVVQPGTLLFEHGALLMMNDWVFDATGDVLPVDPMEQKLLRLHTVLLFLLEVTGGVSPLNAQAAVETPMDLASERAALDAIATARWKPTGESDA